jgi:hypothetical protein
VAAIPEVRRLALSASAKRVAPLLSWDFDVVHMIGLELWSRRIIPTPATPDELGYLFDSPQSVACARALRDAGVAADVRAVAWDAIVATATAQQEVVARAAIASAATKPYIDALSSAHTTMAAQDALVRELQVSS